MIDGLDRVSFTRNKLFPIIAFFTFYSLLSELLTLIFDES